MKANGLPIFHGNAHPANLYCGAHKIAGWRWDEQSAPDMPFEHTYNDRVDVVALGRSRQAVTVQGKNLIDCSKVQSPRSDTTGVWDGSTLTVTGLWYCAVVAKDITWFRVYLEGADLVGSSVEVVGLRVVRGATVKPYTPYRPIIAHPIPELRAIPDGQGGWAARDELYVERVGGEWRLMMRQRVGRVVFDGTEPLQETSTASSTGGKVRYLYTPNPLPANIPSGQSVGITCTRYHPRSPEDTYFAIAGISLNTGGNRVIIFDRDFGNSSGNLVAYKAQLAQWRASGHPMIVDYVLATPIITDLGPIDLPSYYPYTRVLVEGEYPPDVTARCRVVDGV